MSKNQLILNLQTANFLSRLENLQAHGIFLLLCSAVQIHSWSTKALERIQRKKVIRSRKHDLPGKELGLFKFREDWCEKITTFKYGKGNSKAEKQLLAVATKDKTRSKDLKLQQETGRLGIWKTVLTLPTVTHQKPSVWGAGELLGAERLLRTGDTNISEERCSYA